MSYLGGEPESLASAAVFTAEPDEDPKKYATTVIHAVPRDPNMMLRTSLESAGTVWVSMKARMPKKPAENPSQTNRNCSGAYCP